jgi:hypothetical protein
MYLLPHVKLARADDVQCLRRWTGSLGTVCDRMGGRNRVLVNDARRPTLSADLERLEELLQRGELIGVVLLDPVENGLLEVWRLLLRAESLVRIRGLVGDANLTCESL